MTDIFISYARTDRAQAEALASCLEGEGWAVWWDTELVPGEDFAEVIDDQLDTVPVVVVLWTSTSVRSGYVRDEANVGKDRLVLVPVRLDSSRVPLGFRYLHTHSLVGWDGRADAAQLLALVRVIRTRLASPDSPADPTVSVESVPAEPVAEQPRAVEPTVDADPAREPSPGSSTAHGAALRHLRKNVEEATRPSAGAADDLQLLMALTQLADYLGKSGHHEQALEEYQRAEELASNAHASTWSQRIGRGQARALTGLGRHDEAVRLLAKTTDSAADRYALITMIFGVIARLAADPSSSPDARHRVASQHLSTVDRSLWMQRFTSDEWTGEMLATLQRGYAHALLDLAAIAAEAGNHEAAMDLFEKQLLVTTEDDPEWPAVLEQLGHEYVAVGDASQSAGTDQALLTARGFYDLAREIFESRGSVVGLRGVLRRCADVALALDNTPEFEEFLDEREALGMRLAPTRSDFSTDSLDGPQWPVARLEAISVDVRDQQVRLREPVAAVVQLQNTGSLSWREGRGLELKYGIQRKGSSNSSTTSVEPKDKVLPGEVIEVHLNVPWSNYSGAAEVFVWQEGMLWDESAARLTSAIALDSTDPPSSD